MFCSEDANYFKGKGFILNKWKLELPTSNGIQSSVQVSMKMQLQELKGEIFYNASHLTIDVICDSLSWMQSIRHVLWPGRCLTTPCQGKLHERVVYGFPSKVTYAAAVLYLTWWITMQLKINDLSPILFLCHVHPFGMHWPLVNQSNHSSLNLWLCMPPCVCISLPLILCLYFLWHIVPFKVQFRLTVESYPCWHRTKTYSFPSACLLTDYVWNCSLRSLQMWLWFN